MKHRPTRQELESRTTAARPLPLGSLRFSPSVAVHKRPLFLPSVTTIAITVTLTGYTIEFDWEDLKELADGPILVEALSATPEGNFFLVSPELILPSSAVGEAVGDQSFTQGTLLLLKGTTILSEITPGHSTALKNWLLQL